MSSEHLSPQISRRFLFDFNLSPEDRMLEGELLKHVSKEVFENLGKIFQKFHLGLTRVLKSSASLNNDILLHQRQQLVVQNKRIEDYLEVYKAFTDSLSDLIDIRNHAPDLIGTAIQDAVQGPAGKALLFNFIKNLFVLKEWNNYFEKTGNNAARPVFAKPQKSSTHEIKQGDVDNVDAMQEDQETQSGRTNERVFIDPEIQDNRTPSLLSLDSEDVENTASTQPSQSERLPSAQHPFPLPRLQLQERFDLTRKFILDPTERFSDFKFEFWYRTEAIRLCTQTILIAALKKTGYEGYKDSQFFKLYDDKTLFQGKPAMRKFQGAHMNFRPQTYDLITYKILEKISNTKQVGDFERLFLTRRNLWNANDTVENNITNMGILADEFRSTIQSNDPLLTIKRHCKLLDREKFILISSIFARTHYEAASNATCNAPSLSNEVDGHIEWGMQKLIERWEFKLFGYAGPLPNPKDAYTKPRREELVARGALKSSNAPWRQGCKTPPVPPTCKLDALPAELKELMEFIEDILDELSEICRAGKPYDVAKKLNRDRNDNFGVFADTFMLDFTSDNLALGQIAQELDNWLKKICTAPPSPQLKCSILQN